MKAKKINVGQLLMESLTPDQIALLLDVVASGVDLSRYMGDLKKADPDMAATVGKVLKSRGAKAGLGAGTRLASVRRNIENWNSLWRQWDDVVAEVGNEDGKYAVQDRHWEAPYFAGGDLAFDLEPIAGDMLPLIADVYGLVDAPDLYLEALEEIEDNISLYPEWMGAEYGDPFELERKATRCVLKWLWLEAQHEPDPGIGLLERVSDIEESHRLLYLNRSACVEFFVRLPDNVCCEIHSYFKDADHNFDLSKVYSIWHQINHDYESRFDSATYLETCRKHLDDNWRYGRPLIDDALERDRFKDAEILLGKTFASFLGKSKRARWYPETTLLVGQQYFIENQDREEISDLLQTWNKVAVNLGNAKRGAAAKLQSVIFKSPEDCNAVINAYKRLINSKVEKAIKPLFDDWKSEMAERSFPHHLELSKVSDTWIHWIIEAQLDPTAKKEWFRRKLNGWLSELKKDSKAFKKQWGWLACLTADMSESQKLKQKYPMFWKTVLPEKPEAEDLLWHFRCNGLKKMKAGSCLKPAVDAWQTHLRRIVPDPANAYKADYTEHAHWAKALYELNPKAYSALLAQWRKKHNRRRNLWRDMKAAGLSILSNGNR